MENGKRHYPMRRAEMELSDFMGNPLCYGVTMVNNVDQLHGALSRRVYIASEMLTQGEMVHHDV
jgi:hypothetical protein